MFKIWICILLQTFHHMNNCVAGQPTSQFTASSSIASGGIATITSPSNGNALAGNTALTFVSGVNAFLNASSSTMSTNRLQSLATIRMAQQTVSTTTIALSSTNSFLTTQSSPQTMPMNSFQSSPTLPQTNASTFSEVVTMTTANTGRPTFPASNISTSAPTGLVQKNGTNILQIRMGFLMANGLSPALVAAGSNIYFELEQCLLILF